MDAIMDWLAPKVKAFIAWWAELTGTSTKSHGGRAWNWPTITFIVFLWIVLGIIVYFYG
jgi:hypothetical protein